MHDYTLHNYSQTRRSVRSTMNAPVPPRDEGVLNLVWLAIILPKSLLAGVRITRRSNRSDDVFFDFVCASKFSSQNPS